MLVGLIADYVVEVHKREPLLCSVAEQAMQEPSVADRRRYKLRKVTSPLEPLFHITRTEHIDRLSPHAHTVHGNLGEPKSPCFPLSSPAN